MFPPVWERVFIDQLLTPPIDVYDQLQVDQHFDSFSERSRSTLPSVINTGSV